MLRSGNLISDSILDEVLADGVKSGARAVELGDNGELLSSVDGLAHAVEVGVALTEGVEITTISVAETGITVRRVSATTVLEGADKVTVGITRMRSQGEGLAVGLPEIHLGTAAAVVTNAGVGIALRGFPAISVGLSQREVLSV